MLGPDVLAPFAVAAALLALAPGPDNLFVLTQSAMNGVRAGIWLVLGLCSGLLVHSVAVALGLAAVIQASALAFTAIKLAGACYLLYLAWMAWNAPVKGLGKAEPMPPVALYKRGVIMNITNPKVAIFFLAFFPQFIDPDKGNTIWQIAQLGMIFAIVAFLIFSAIAVLAGGLSTRMRENPSIQRVLNRLAAVVFVGLAVNIAASSR